MEIYESPRKVLESCTFKKESGRTEGITVGLEKDIRLHKGSQRDICGPCLFCRFSNIGAKTF